MAPILRYFVVRPAREVVLPSGEVEKQLETIVPFKREAYTQVVAAFRGWGDGASSRGGAN